MRLFAAAARVTVKRCAGWTAALLALFGTVFLLIWAAERALPAKVRPPARVAVVNQDQNPVLTLALETMLSGEGFSDLFSISFITEEEKLDGDYAAVVTIPPGFLDSVMDGTNSAPKVEVSLSSPIESLYARQMLMAGTGYLGAAQASIYGILREVDESGALTDAQRADLALQVNLAYLDGFFARKDLLSTKTLPGRAETARRAGASIAAMLLLAYGFFFCSAVLDIRSFLKAARLRRGARLLAFGGVFAGVYAASLLALVPLFLALRGADGAVRVLMLALVLAAFSVWIGSLFSSFAACCCASLMLSLGMGFLSGGLMPLELMPPLFKKLAPLTVNYQASALLLPAEGGGMNPVPAMLVVAVLVLSALILFLYRTDGRMEG